MAAVERRRTRILEPIVEFFNRLLALKRQEVRTAVLPPAWTAFTMQEACATWIAMRFRCLVGLGPRCNNVNDAYCDSRTSSLYEELGNANAEVRCAVSIPVSPVHSSKSFAVGSSIILRPRRRWGDGGGALLPVRGYGVSSDASFQKRSEGNRSPNDMRPQPATSVQRKALIDRFRRGVRAAEGAGFENQCASYIVPGVRIPPSPFYRVFEPKTRFFHVRYPYVPKDAMKCDPFVLHRHSLHDRRWQWV